MIRRSRLLQPKSASPLHADALDRVFYHGTSTEAAAQAILANGIQPREVSMPDKAKDRGHLAPARGRVYITPDFNFAAIHALGSRTFGTDYYTKYNIGPLKDKNPYGYIFEMRGEDLKGDIVPEEDSIGGFISELLQMDRAVKRHAEITQQRSPLKWPGEAGELNTHIARAAQSPINAPSTPESLRSELRRAAASCMTERQREKVLDYHIDGQAVVGNKVQKIMSPELIKWMLDNGAHAAHLGAIFPVKAWRFKKTDAKTVQQDQVMSICEEIPVQHSKAASVSKTGDWARAEDLQTGDLIAFPAPAVKVRSVHRENDEIIVLGPPGVIRRFDPQDEVNFLRKTAAQPPSLTFRKTMANGLVKIEAMSEDESVAILWVNEEDHQWIVESVAVDDNFRGKGVGLALYREGIRFAREAGVRAFTSDFDVSEDAERIWNRLGESEDIRHSGSRFYVITGDKKTRVASSVTETPSFKSWFSGSKVVDGSGNPLVLYHGTPHDFGNKNFSVGGAGRGSMESFGFHFGPSEAANNRLARGMEKYDAHEYNWNVMPAYLSIKHPLRLPDFGDWENLKRLGRHLIKVGIDEKKVNDALARSGHATRIRALIKVLQAEGYDGIVYFNLHELGGDSWVAFDPRQIKSAIGNNGEFDAKSMSMTSAASLRTISFKQLWHGTATDFDQLKPNRYGIIWAGGKTTARTYAEQDLASKWDESGKKRLIPVKLRSGSKVVDLRDKQDPIVAEFFTKVKPERQEDTSHNQIENSWAIPFLREKGVDAVLVTDSYTGSENAGHLAIGIINPDAISGATQGKQAQIKLHNTQREDTDGWFEGEIFETHEEFMHELENYGITEFPSRLEYTKGHPVAYIGFLEANERGQGIGTKLMADFLTQARAASAVAAVLVTDTDRSQKRGFSLLRWYLNQGFERVKRMDNEWLMAKKL